MNIGLIILLIANVFFYLLSCFIIIKKRNRTSISIRSPLLLLINNISGCILSSMVILYMLMQSSISSTNSALMIFYSFFYLFQMIMITSIIFRYQRIISCCKIDIDEKIDTKNFITKRHLFYISYYLKIILAITVTVSILIIILDSLSFTDHFNIFHLSLQHNDSQYIWLIINFIQVAILITYSRIMKIYDVNQSLNIEAALFSFFWMVISNGISLHHLYKRNDYVFIIITLIGFYGCLFVNGVLPILFLFMRKNIIGYHFNPKLMNNLYLFLANEHCYAAFSQFISNAQKDMYYLGVYTGIMRLQLQLLNNESVEVLKATADNICEIYLNSTIPFLDSELVKETKEKYSKMVIELNKEFNTKAFDDVLIAAFVHLTMRFNEFKQSDDYIHLNELMALDSYLQCKMQNIGLVNDV